MQRKHVLFLAIAVVVVGAVSAVLSSGSLLRTEATAGETRMQLGAAGTGVTCPSVDKCTVPLSGVFNLEVSVINWPPDPDGPPIGTPCATGCLDAGYSAMATDVDWTGTSLTYTKLSDAVEVPWPERGHITSANTPVEGFPNRIQHGDLSTAAGATPSTFKGVIVRLQFTCSAGNSTNLVTLVPQDAANPNGAALADEAATVFPTPDTITINCGTGGGAPTATATTEAPTATVAGPTNTPGPTDTPAPPTATSEPGAATPTPTNTVAAPPTATRTATPIVPPTATPISDLGDVDKDGDIDSIDAALVLQHEAGLFDLSDQDNADVDRDGDINSVDALYVLWIVAGLYP